MYLKKLPHYEPPEVVIHRSAKRIIQAGDSNLYKPQETGTPRGWRSPEDQPYRPIGNFQRVVPIFECLKRQLPNSQEISTVGQKNINNLKRNPNNIYNWKESTEPDRTWLTLTRAVVDFQQYEQRLDQRQGNQKGDNEEERPKQPKPQNQIGPDGKKIQGFVVDPQQERIDLRQVHEADTRGIMHRMAKLEKDFTKIPLEQLAKKKEDKKKDQSGVRQMNESELEREQKSNQRLLTPRMRKMMKSKDAAVMLKEEVGESLKRLKAAKQGRKLTIISPQHQNSFYLPDQQNFKVITPQFQDLRYGLKSQDGARARNSKFQNHNTQQVKAEERANTAFTKENTNISHLDESQMLTQRPGISSMVQTHRDPHTGYQLPHAVAQKLHQQQQQQQQFGNSFFVTAEDQQQQQQLYQNPQTTRSAYAVSQLPNSVNQKRPNTMGASRGVKPQHLQIQSPMDLFHNQQARLNHQYASPNSIASTGDGQIGNRATTANTNTIPTCPSANLTPLGFHQNNVPNTTQHHGTSLQNYQFGNSFFQNKQGRKSMQQTSLWKSKSGIQQHIARNPSKINDVSARFQQRYGELAFSSDHPLLFKQDDPNYQLAKQDEQSDPVNKQLNAPKQPEIKFISAIDSKPITPAFIKLLSLHDYIELQKNEEDQGPGGDEGGTSGDTSRQNKKQQLAKKLFNIQKDEHWDMIRAGEFIETMSTLAGGYVGQAEDQQAECKERLDREAQELARATRFKSKVTSSIQRAKQREGKDIKHGADNAQLNVNYANGGTISPSNNSDENESRAMMTPKQNSKGVSFVNQDKQVNLAKVLNQNDEDAKLDFELDDHQEMLLNRLIQFESLKLCHGQDKIKRKIWHYLFNWDGEQNGQTFKSSDNLLPKNTLNLSHKRSVVVGKRGIEKTQQEEEAARQKEEERQERIKKEQLKKEAHLNEFQDKGGFTAVLQDIFNPRDLQNMELDSVFQLKQLCRQMYSRKGRVSQQLIQTLDALANERPNMLLTKRKHFKGGHGDVDYGNQRTTMEWMRINAEKERIQRYKQIVKKSGQLYYNVVEKFAKLLEDRKQAQTSDRKPVKPNSSTQQLQVQKEESEKQFGAIMEQNKVDSQLEKSLQFMCEFMRQVIEAGIDFNFNHFFILLLQLDINELKLNLHEFVKILIQEIQIPREEVEIFIDGIQLKDMKIKLFDFIERFISAVQGSGTTNNGELGIISGNALNLN